MKDYGVEKMNGQIVEANIKLQDENKCLQEDNKKLQKRIEDAIKYIEDKSIEYKPKFRKVDLNTKDCCELLNILDGDDANGFNK